MVVTTLPALVADIARRQGAAHPAGDLVHSPKPPRPSRLCCRRPMPLRAAPRPCRLSGAGSPNEPYALDGAAVGSLSERMGGWVIAACNDKRLAFALAFPFVRKPLSLEAVNSTALQNAAWACWSSFQAPTCRS